MNGQTIIRTGDYVFHEKKKFKVMHVVDKLKQLRLYAIAADIDELYLYDGEQPKVVKIQDIKLK